MQDGKEVWLDWMDGLRDTGGSSDSFAGVPGCPIIDFEIVEATLGPGGWTCCQRLRDWIDITFLEELYEQDEFAGR